MTAVAYAMMSGLGWNPNIRRRSLKTFRSQALRQCSNVGEGARVPDAGNEPVSVFSANLDERFDHFFFFVGRQIAVDVIVNLVPAPATFDEPK